MLAHAGELEMLLLQRQWQVRIHSARQREGWKSNALIRADAREK